MHDVKIVYNNKVCVVYPSAFVDGNKEKPYEYRVKTPNSTIFHHGFDNIKDALFYAYEWLSIGDDINSFLMDSAYESDEEFNPIKKPKDYRDSLEDVFALFDKAFANLNDK